MIALWLWLSSGATKHHPLRLEQAQTRLRASQEDRYHAFPLQRKFLTPLDRAFQFASRELKKIAPMLPCG